MTTLSVLLPVPVTHIQSVSLTMLQGSSFVPLPQWSKVKRLENKLSQSRHMNALRQLYLLGTANKPLVKNQILKLKV